MTSPEDPPDYATSPFTSQVHQDRAIAGTTGLAQNAVSTMRNKLIESIMQLVVQAITGILTPFGLGSAFTQLQEWASDISQQIADLVLQIPVIGPIVEWLASLFGVDIGDVGDPSVDFGGIWSNIVSVFINPLGFFANLISGLIPGFQIPGLDASKITSGIFNLVQLPATVLNSITGVAGNLINSILGGSVIPGLDASKITSGIMNLANLPATLLNSITGVAGNLINSIIGGGFIPGLDASKIISGNFAQSIVTGLTSDLTGLVNTAHDIVDGIVNSLTGSLGSLWPQAQANDALKAQADALAQAAAALAAIQASQNNNNTGGLNAIFDFSHYPDSTNLPADFVQTYTGSGVTATYGVVNGNGSTTGFEAFNTVRNFFGETTVDTVTDYQRVGAVWTGVPGISYNNPTPFFLPLPYFGAYRAETDLYCRYKDVNNWVRLRFLPGDGVGNVPAMLLESCISGTITTLASTGNGLTPNTVTWLEAGFGVSARTYRVISGTQVLLTYTDPGTATQVGSAFRGAAMGGTLVGAQGLGIPVNTSPILYMALQDNSPANVVGSGARVFRASTGTVTQTAGAQITNAFLDTVEFLTDEYTFTSGSNCRITVSKTDWYVVSARVLGFDLMNLFVNGTVARKSGLSSGIGAVVGMASVLYLQAGDYVSIGYGGSTTATVGGSADGTAAYLEITRVGRVNS